MVVVVDRSTTRRHQMGWTDDSPDRSALHSIGRDHPDRTFDLCQGEGRGSNPVVRSNETPGAVRCSIACGPLTVVSLPMTRARLAHERRTVRPWREGRCATVEMTRGSCASTAASTRQPASSGGRRRPCTAAAVTPQGSWRTSSSRCATPRHEPAPSEPARPLVRGRLAALGTADRDPDPVTEQLGVEIVRSERAVATAARSAVQRRGAR